MKLSIFVITLLSLIHSLGASAESFAATDAEYRQLPPYCLAKVKGDYTPWVSYFGGTENANHMHHYCDCLRFQSRAMRAMDPGQRRYNYKNAVDGCEYVLVHARPDFFMRAEILTQKAKALLGTGDEGQAATSLIKAIEFDPKYTPAYVALANYFTNRQNKKLALEYLERGMVNAPESKALRRRYLELGGKKPLPEIPAKPEPESTPVTNEPQEGKTGDPLSPAEIRSKRKVPATEEVTPKELPEDAAKSATPDAAPPKIGTPSNPWCRFCTEETSPPNQPPATPAVDSTNRQ